MRASAVVAAVVIACSASVGHGQSRVRLHDMSLSPVVEVGANLRIKKIMGEVGTFMIGTFKAGWKNAPHHHTHEQINVGLARAFNIVTPTSPHTVAWLQGLVIPPDVMHGNDVTGAIVDPVLIEFQPVRRVDFPPEREKVAFKTAVSPIAAPADMDLDFRPESPSWQRHASGARMNIKKGQGVAVSAWELPASLTEPVEILPQVPGAELFIYVLDGKIDVTVGADRYETQADVLMVIAPNAPAPRVRSTGTSTVLVFESARLP